LRETSLLGKLLSFKMSFPAKKKEKTDVGKSCGPPKPPERAKKSRERASCGTSPAAKKGERLSER